MAQWVLKANGNVVPRCSLRPLQTAEIYSDSEKKKRELFNKLIYERHGDSINVVLPNTDRPVTERYEDGDEPARPIPDIEETVDANGRALNQLPAYDRLLNAEVQLQHDNRVTTGKVKHQALGPDGNMDGKYDNNPTLNSIMYEVEFANGTVKEYGANIIAENMLRQVDLEGFSVALMEGIVDLRCDESVAVPIEEKYIITKTGQKRFRKTTAGWDLLVPWKDESESWVRLSDMKESHPVEMAEFAKAKGIQGEPAFCWWVSCTLRKRDAIVAAVGARIRKTTHKYGVEIPKDVYQSRELDKRNENTMWMDVLAKEMLNVGIAFEVLEDKQSAPTGLVQSYRPSHVGCENGFHTKGPVGVRWPKTPDPIRSTYAGVVSRESVRIAFTYTALNGLDVFAADIRNTYLQVPLSQKHYIICGPEFGLENEG